MRIVAKFARTRIVEKSKTSMVVFSIDLSMQLSYIIHMFKEWIRKRNRLYPASSFQLFAGSALTLIVVLFIVAMYFMNQSWLGPASASIFLFGMVMITAKSNHNAEKSNILKKVGMLETASIRKR